MLTILPAIDILDNKVVRLKKGDYNQVVSYSAEPVSVARSFLEKGYKWLHLVNLSGARDGGIDAVTSILNEISGLGLKIEAGGGVRSLSDIEKYLKAGADRVIIGTKAFTDRDFVRQAVKEFDREKIVIGMDVLEGAVMIRGWQEDSGWALEEAISFLVDNGANLLLCTDISRDGMLSGVNLRLYETVCELFSGRVIASGGVASQKDIDALSQLSDKFVNLWGVVIGKAFYENRI